MQNNRWVACLYRLLKLRFWHILKFVGIFCLAWEIQNISGVVCGYQFLRFPQHLEIIPQVKLATNSIIKANRLRMLEPGPEPREAFGGSALPNIFRAPPNCVVHRNICFKHIIKTKIFSPWIYISPPNLKTWLRAWLELLQVCHLPLNWEITVDFHIDF